MAVDRSSFNLFGIDLLQVYDHWRQGWAEALQWPFFTRFFPVEPVCILLPDGTESVWPVVQDNSSGTLSQAMRTLAVLLPDDKVLRRQIVLPRLAAHDQLQAVELAVQAASPFPLERVVWGFHAIPVEQRVQIDIALAAREHVEQHLQLMHLSAGVAGIDGGGPSGEGVEPVAGGGSRRGGKNIEVWACANPPIVLGGFEEAQRQKRARSARNKILLLVLVFILLAGVLLVSSVLHKRTQVFQAQEQLDLLVQEVKPVVAERDALGLANERLQSVQHYQNARPDPRRVLGRLSTLLPDNVYLTRLDVHGRTVTIGGLAENAAGVMEMLGAQPDFAEVKAPSAISRDGMSGRESFTIEFKLLDEGQAP